MQVTLILKQYFLVKTKLVLKGGIMFFLHSLILILFFYKGFLILYLKTTQLVKVILIITLINQYYFKMNL